MCCGSACYGEAPDCGPGPARLAAMKDPQVLVLNALFFDPGVSGGTETYLRGLVPALRDELPDTRIVVATTRRGARALRADGWGSWCEVVALPCDVGEAAARLLAEQVLLPALALRRRADIIHDLASTGPGWTPMTRHVTTIHDVTALHEGSFGRLHTAVFRAVLHAVARDADAALTGTAVAQRDVAAVLGLDSTALIVAHHGRVPVDQVPTANGPAERDGRVVLYPAGKRPHKNQELLIRALPLLPDDIRLVLVGRAESHDAVLRRIATEEGVTERVDFRDYVTDEELEQLWLEADALAFPSRAEGFGLPLIEAMERGVPVACSDIPVLREVGGDVARYFPVDDPEACAVALLDTLCGEDRRGSGRERASSFTWQAAARTTRTAYEIAMTRPASIGRGRGLTRSTAAEPGPTGETATIDPAADWVDVIRHRDRSPIGSIATAGKTASLPLGELGAARIRALAGVRSFVLDGRSLPYTVHRYNETWRNERAVELPIAFDWLDHRPAGRVLEVGHVLGHYRRNMDHTVVDLYEPSPGVLNVDALDFNPPHRFRSIVAVSTIEHVGFDEEDQDGDKTRRLLDHLCSLLTLDGELLVTFPLGYNRYLDDHLTSGRLGLHHVSVMRRKTTLGQWVQTDLDDVPRARYGFPFHYGNVIAVGRRGASPAAGTAPTR
jgi:glycosyltransferase involved in cell wall biosynthesis